MQKNIMAGLFIVTVLAVGSSYYFYNKYQDLKQSPQVVAEDENAIFITKLGQLMDLPENEQPTIFTVSDLSKLEDQPFFAKAKVGDRVFIYTNTKRAILYDPVANRIIEIAPINIGK